MKEIRGYLIVTGIILLLLAGLFYCGYRYYPVRNPSPIPDVKIKYIYDTVTHLIRDTVPYYIVYRDSVIKWREVPAVIDTMAILVDYYSLHYYTRNWEDSLLLATSEDVISENKFIDNVFTYQIKRPQQIINNDYSINYTKYLNIGVNLPISKMEYAEIEALYAFRRGHVGVGYIPSLRSPSFKIGLNLFRLQ